MPATFLVQTTAETTPDELVASISANREDWLEIIEAVDAYFQDMDFLNEIRLLVKRQWEDQRMYDPEGVAEYEAEESKR